MPAMTRHISSWILPAIAILMATASHTLTGAQPSQGPVQSALLAIKGTVHLPDGSPASNAVVISAFGGQAVSDDTGAFTLRIDAPTDAKEIGLTAVATVSGVNLSTSVTIVHKILAYGEDGVAITLRETGKCEPAWMPTVGQSTTGVNQVVWAMAVFDDGEGPALYVGGEFTAAGDVELNGIAKWDGTDWSPLGEGVGGTLPYVYSLSVFDDGSGSALYAGGRFTMAGGANAHFIAKWDGAEWTPLGEGLSAPPWYIPATTAMAVFDDGAGSALYVGGAFTAAGGVEALHIARWDGSEWSSLGGGVDDIVWSLATFNDGAGTALYAGGDFVHAGAVASNSIARWDGQAWSALDGGVGGVLSPSVYALQTFDDGAGLALYAGGRFSTAGDSQASNIARWDGDQWEPLGVGADSAVRALAVFDDGDSEALYAGGEFATAAGSGADYLARWNGDDWSALEETIDGHLFSLTATGGDHGASLYAGGFFGSAGGVAATRIARWDGQNWSPLGNGIDSEIRDITVYDDGDGEALYICGAFTSVDGVPAKRIARWDGMEWSAVGGGTGFRIDALAVFDRGDGPALYAGGSFLSAGGVAANRIARWDAEEWSALGSGTSGLVNSLAVFDDGSGPALFAGGEFIMAGDQTVNRVAKWDGENWSPLDGGVSGGPVNTLAVFDDGHGAALYVGGAFTLAGNQMARRIARWDGKSWSPLDTGIGNEQFQSVNSLAVFDDGTGQALYAGGFFHTAGGEAADNIARWDGNEWSAFGSGIGGDGVAIIRALASFDDGDGPALYAGGSVGIADSATASLVAKWDGRVWTPLDDGFGGLSVPSVIALKAFDDGSGPALYAGGSFTLSPAGDARLAKWQGCPPESAPGDLNGDGIVDGADLAILLANWGTCPPEPELCPSDLTGDGAVDGADLAVVLSNWGSFTEN